MKKSIFILVALFAATFANAQITLLHTFDGFAIIPQSFQVEGNGEYINVYGDLIGVYSTTHYEIYDANTYSLICSYNRANMQLSIISRNYFTTDGSVVILGYTIDSNTTNNNQKQHVYLFKEDGTILQDLGACNNLRRSHIWQLSTGEYRLAVVKYFESGYKTEIYSLPGNGVATEISSPAPQKSSARKIAREGQVLIETETNTYTLQGAEVK